MASQLTSGKGSFSCRLCTKPCPALHVTHGQTHTQQRQHAPTNFEFPFLCIGAGNTRMLMSSSHACKTALMSTCVRSSGHVPFTPRWAAPLRS